ncbi:hypothetical protein MLD38_016083 [Melastoma candidum]|uniref:Uncharacterized protein n=1 Tax=Melastoma candidum TaxID=119954 RepID=A0ACB9RIE1_9MYRT|nr:hypothetical protein MLD38_016083 [Melastoma candidum]
MGSWGIRGVSLLSLFLLLLSFALPPASSSSSSASPQINSNSILVALLDSRYTSLAELLEKALLLPSLESAVSRHNLTIFAPTNDALDRLCDPDFKLFLLQPRHLPSLQSLLTFHVLPSFVPLSGSTTRQPTLSGDAVSVSFDNAGAVFIDSAAVVHPNDVVRPDGVVHGIDRALIPRSVQDEFNRRRSLRSISAVLPEGAPEVDPRTHRLKKPAPPVPAGSPPVLPIFDAMAPGPSLAPAPAPGPGGPKGHFDGESQVKDFIHTLLKYGGYNEMADMLVNLTSLATEMGRLVSEGYVLTVLAPNDEAMAKLSVEQLSEPGAPEQILYYHLIPEYQTEESMYNSVRRFGKVKYETLRVPEKVVAQEADGSVRFGYGQDGEGTAYLYDPDIYTDGRISVQGIDGVLFPPKVEKKKKAAMEKKVVKVVTAKPRRGKLMEVACTLLGAIGRHSHFSC